MNIKSLKDVPAQNLMFSGGEKVEKTQRELQLEEIETEYMVILAEMIEYAQKNLNQSIERNKVPEKFNGDWRIFSTKIKIPKAIAVEKGYCNSIFTEVRGTVNSKFHICEEYETSINGETNIVLTISPIMKNSYSYKKKDKELPVAQKYGNLVRAEIRKYFQKISKNEYYTLVEDFGFYGTIEIPIRIPNRVDDAKLNEYRRSRPQCFAGIVDFRKPHRSSPIREEGYNMYVKVRKLKF